MHILERAATLANCFTFSGIAFSQVDLDLKVWGWNSLNCLKVGKPVNLYYLSSDGILNKGVGICSAMFLKLEMKCTFLKSSSENLQ